MYRDRESGIFKDNPNPIVSIKCLFQCVWCTKVSVVLISPSYFQRGRNKVLFLLLPTPLEPG